MKESYKQDSKYFIEAKHKTICNNFIVADLEALFEKWDEKK